MSQDLYAILGVEKRSNQAEIKKAYIILARKYHPDKNKDEPDKFKEISHAYDILSDPEKRRDYDLKSSTSSHRNTGGYSNQGYSYRHDGSSQQSRPRAKTPPFPQPRPISTEGFKIEVTVHVSLKDIYTGAPEYNVVYRERIDCKTCQSNCSYCNGAGYFKSNHQVFQCEYCHRTGKTGTANGCNVCRNERKEKNIKIDIPRGVHNNHIILLQNMGNLLPDRSSRPDGRVRGDLRIKIMTSSTSSDNVFVRRGNNLHIKHAITLKEALMGFKLKLLCTHLDGRLVRITQTPGLVIYPQKVKVLKGEGMPIFQSKNEEKGDLYVTFDVVFPESLQMPTNPAEKEIISNFLETPEERETRERTIIIEDNESSDSSSAEDEEEGEEEGDSEDDDVEELPEIDHTAQKRPFTTMEEDTEVFDELLPNDDDMEEDDSNEKYSSPPEKRQKQGTDSPPECINLVDDDDEEEVEEVAGSTPAQNSNTIPDLFDQLFQDFDYSSLGCDN